MTCIGSANPDVMVYSLIMGVRTGFGAHGALKRRSYRSMCVCDTSQLMLNADLTRYWDCSYSNDQLGLHES